MPAGWYNCANEESFGLFKNLSSSARSLRIEAELSLKRIIVPVATSALISVYLFQIGSSYEVAGRAVPGIG